MKRFCFVHLPAASDCSRVDFFLGFEIIAKGPDGLHFLDYVLLVFDDFFKFDDFDLIIIDFVGLEVIVKVKVSLSRYWNFPILSLYGNANPLSELTFPLRSISLIGVLQFLALLIIQSLQYFILTLHLFMLLILLLNNPLQLHWIR